MIDKGIVKMIIRESDRLLLFVERHSNRIITPKNWTGKVGDEIEYEYRGWNWAMLIQKPIKLWIVIYHHRFGTDGMPVWQSDEPNLEEFTKTLSNFEPDREDEYLELSGPFDIPSF
jgi:hypothetical protein